MEPVLLQLCRLGGFLGTPASVLQLIILALTGLRRPHHGSVHLRGPRQIQSGVAAIRLTAPSLRERIRLWVEMVA